MQRGEVEYSLRAIPLGGYVAFPDDDPNSPIPPDDPNLLKNRSIPERAAVISAGVIANFIFAYTALLLQVCTRRAVHSRTTHCTCVKESTRMHAEVPCFTHDVGSGTLGGIWIVHLITHSPAAPRIFHCLISVHNPRVHV